MTINDPIHKTIEVHPLCKKIIDTPEFQRLRQIKQCGICHLVYPSAVHTRFEHSVGVYYLAGKLLDKIKSTTTITPQDELCVKIAALLHDLGHGPFSHLWENFVNRQRSEEDPPKKKFRHEDMSVALFKFLLKNNNLKEEFRSWGLNDEKVTLIENIISGNIDNEKRFLFEIVANKVTNIDVDRWDYLLRDAYFFGVHCPVSFDRIIAYTLVMEKDGEKRIAFRDKLETDLLDVFECRFKLHKICYQHVVCHSLELMIMDVLKAADSSLIPQDGKKLSNLDEGDENDLKIFLSLNDGLLNNIRFSDLEDAKHILQRIDVRNLYKLVEKYSLKNELKKDELIDDLKKVENYINEEYNVSLRLSLKDLSMGIDGDDPFKNVVFYDKSNNIVPLSSHKKRELSLLVFTVDDRIGGREKIVLGALEKSDFLVKNISK